MKEMTERAMLYLIPVSLGGGITQNEIPSGNADIINTLDEFIVENIRTARRFLRAMGYKADFENVTFHLLDKHTSHETLPSFLNNAVHHHKNIGLLSEAGNPCIADPGQKIVSLAHQAAIKIVPLVGPSSILLALIASGFNGQSFVFHGYLPIEQKARIQSLRGLESDALRKDQTQIFMETPYRNNAILEDIIKTCKDDTLLCIAANLTTAEEYIKTQSVAKWKKQLPNLHKQPAVFLLYK